jgi:ppGpp synthetase/RelA/SpoT-type nucleotidyltranferase
MVQQPRNEPKLQQALDKLLNTISNKAKEVEEKFFEGIQEQLCQLCDRIAEEIHADSASLFFVTEDNPPGSKPFMVLRGASGRLGDTFNKWVGTWQKWREQQKEKDGEQQELPDFNGFAYPSELPDGFFEGNQRPQEIEFVGRQVIKNWKVTNQIWHLAQGRIANSNRAMDELHGGPSRTGRGDTIAYSGKNLHTTFRTMVGVPIFAQGGNIQTVQLKEKQKASDRHPPSASPITEFLSKYRVIGILKLEGKRPPEYKILETTILEKVFEERLVEEIKKQNLSDRDKDEFKNWSIALGKNINSLQEAFRSEGTKLCDLLQDKRPDGSEKSKVEKKKALILRKGIADIFTELCHAEFIRQDVELLVLLAMQVGRLMTRRVMKYAADKGIVISETEVGLLNIRWRDINHLVTLKNAAEAAKRKVEYHLEALKAELDFCKRQDVFQARVSELLDSHGPIHEVKARRKEFLSLVRKLVNKQQSLEDESDICEVSFPNFKCKVEDFGCRSGEQCIMRGGAKLFIHRPAIGSGQVDMGMNLGIEGAPQVTIDGKNLPVDLKHYQNTYDLDSPLVRRILNPNVYHVDDLAGTRIITNYDSDIDEVVDELRRRGGEWGMELGKIDDMRKGKKGGYRAVHITLYVDISQLLPESDIKTLKQAIGSSHEEQLVKKFPIEIQLKTAYQHSWSLKTHAISYKREEQISQESLDEQEILANVLAQADWLSGIVRSSIESMLLPPDYGERKLLDFLKRCITRDDMNLIRFGIACTKEVLKDQLRYNGKPEYSFAMEVCNHLVYKFRVIDSKMLLLALLRNIWRLERGEANLPEHASRGSNPSSSKQIDLLIVDLNNWLKQICPSAWDRYSKLLPLPLGRKKLRDWFWIMQTNFRDYFQQPPEDRTKQVRERLQNIYDRLKESYCEDEEQEKIELWLERAYLMEAAILLANLSELSFEPGTIRRKRLYSDYLSLYHEIRKYFPNGPTKTHVIEELDRSFRKKETRIIMPWESERSGE